MSQAFAQPSPSLSPPSPSPPATAANDPLSGPTLESRLLAESAAALAAAARKEGDPQRGAIAFHQSLLACGRCHVVADEPASSRKVSIQGGLGPDLTAIPADEPDAEIVLSILQPSRKIRQGFETATVVLDSGKTLTGMIVERTPERLVLRDAARFGEPVTLNAGEVEEVRAQTTSLMPAGQVNQLAGRQQFLDLVRYVFEIRSGGPARARELQPPPSLLAATMPDYESRLDHAGLLRSLDGDALRRGEKIYARVCANCHGTLEAPGSLPTSLRFAEGKFRNGNDPFAMYQTLTRGFGLMAAQGWMVPRQKYDVIHYIRESYLKGRNPSQYAPLDSDYLAGLPRGDTRGPEPSNIEPWVVMDYGPSLMGTYEFPGVADGARPNIAYKGIAVRLDPGAGGVSRGRHWVVYDHDTMRVAGVWSREPAAKTSPFIDWGGIHFDGRHSTHPRVSGEIAWANPVGPGWSRPVDSLPDAQQAGFREDALFVDDQRVVGRDQRRYGPLPRSWSRFRGIYHSGLQTVVAYELGGDCQVLELPRLVSTTDGKEIFARQFEMGPRKRPLLLSLAASPQSPVVKLEGTDASPLKLRTWSNPAADFAWFGPERVASGGSAESGGGAPESGGKAVKESERATQRGDSVPDGQTVRFDGRTFMEVVESTAGGARQPAAATAAADASSTDFVLGQSDFSIVARIRTRRGGTVMAFAPPGSKWAPDGQSLFIRDGRLTFDIGWVGAVASRSRVDDGQWHAVAMTWEQASRRVRLYVDGKLDGEGSLAPQRGLDSTVVRIGFTSPNFPAQSFFEGDIDVVRFYRQRLTEAETAVTASTTSATSAATTAATSASTSAATSAATSASPANRESKDSSGSAVSKPVAEWRPGVAMVAGRVEDRSGRGHHGVVRRGAAAGRTALAGRHPGTSGTSVTSGTLVAGIAPRIDGVAWHSSAEGQLRLAIPAGDSVLRFTVWTTRTAAVTEDAARGLAASVVVEEPAGALERYTRGGPPRWPQKLETEAVIGAARGPFAVDILSGPLNNPWLAQLRFTGLDFYPDGDRMAACTWDGDVWLVSGLKGVMAATSTTTSTATSPVPAPKLTWQRIASGLFQPLGLRIVAGRIHLTCRDQLAVLHDLNGDGETDFYECLNNDHQVTEHFHEFAMGLQTDAAGNFYYAKSARHALPAVVPHHGTLLRVSADGTRTDILATGFRAANGVCLNPDGSFIVTDQEGHWNPKNRINWVEATGRDAFYGNMFGYHDITDSSDSAMRPPVCWITNAFDRSPAELLWVDSERWGPLRGSLLNLSYGYGKIFVVPHERVAGQMQGGMCELPLPVFPTGLIRGRFHPGDGQLYACGMFAWAGSATQPGGLYRVRYTGQAVHLPIKLEARSGVVRLGFSGDLDPASVADLAKFKLKIWSLKRTANYGSAHHDERPLEVKAARLEPDRRTIRLEVPELRPTWCMEIVYDVRGSGGEPIHGTIHNTIHSLEEAANPAVPAKQLPAKP
jgi:putative heme-binding domain-containing protein